MSEGAALTIPTLDAVDGSSHVTHRGYVPEGGLLYVRFKGGRLFRYTGVPPDVWEKFVAAESPGSFLHRNVRGVFPHAPVDE